MFEVLAAAPNQPFAIALGIMLALAALEVLGLVLGAGLSDAIDSVLPDLDFDADIDLDLDLDADGLDAVEGPGILLSALSWLCIGKVPALMLLVFFLTAFGLTGLFLQITIHGISGSYLPGFLASIPAFICAIPLTRVFGLSFAKVMPKEETEAVSAKTFIGRVATITKGAARRDLPAEAKLHDEFGQAHYVLVEPDLDGDVFDAGSEVLIVRQVGSFYRVIKNTTAVLSKEE